jgi:hypothetical protein
LSFGRLLPICPYRRTSLGWSALGQSLT